MISRNYWHKQDLQAEILLFSTKLSLIWLQGMKLCSIR